MSEKQVVSLEQQLAGNISRRRLLLGGAGALGALTLARAPGALATVERASNSKSIAFAQPDTSAGVYPLLLKGAKAGASKRGYELLESHANHQLDNQVNEINTWIAQEIGGMIVLPLDNNAMLPLIQKAHDKQREVPRLLRQGFARDGRLGHLQQPSGRPARRHRCRPLGEPSARWQGEGRAADS